MPISTVDDFATISTTEYSLPNDSTTLTPQTDDCLLQVWIDFDALIAGDSYEWTVYEKVNGAAATQRNVAGGTRAGVQLHPVVTPTLIMTHGWDVTVKKLTGTDRSIGWSLRKIT